MLIEKIDILDFKNIADASLRFCSGVNCLLGMNGMGKSNLLEAIHFLCLARPMHPMPENALIRHAEEQLLVKGEFKSDSGSNSKVSCGIIPGKGKSLKLDGKEYQRISDHYGRYPLVTVTPSDSDIVTGSGEERRRLLDMVLSQSSPGYLTNLIRYRQGIDSRNRMLKAGLRDKLLYESVEATITVAAAAIHKARAAWVEEIAPRLSDYYSQIAGPEESASISYRSSLNNKTMQEVLDERREKDRVLGYTSGGVHRDDLETSLGDYSLRRLGSQGQLKTFTIALRLAIFEYLRESLRETPLLLLDDIFDKLDSDRVDRIMQLVSASAGFGQIFITDTNRQHLDEIIASISGPRQLLIVEDGKFSPAEQEENKENHQNETQEP